MSWSLGRAACFSLQVLTKLTLLSLKDVWRACDQNFLHLLSMGCNLVDVCAYLFGSGSDERVTNSFLSRGGCLFKSANQNNGL